ncbi:MAG: hypothetical protein KF685_06300 [Acidobacteria bacterium]|nr:hypothetical protein [Acidobacteriota bacterium]
MRDNFWGNDENNDLPAAWESVCVPDPDKCGSTHFSVNDDHYFVDFQLFDTEEEAAAAFEKERRSSSDDIRNGDIQDAAGRLVGQKTIFRRQEKQETIRYALVWTRGKRLAIVTAEKLESINAYETDRGM